MNSRFILLQVAEDMEAGATIEQDKEIEMTEKPSENKASVQAGSGGTGGTLEV